jgi:hypothetical protein
MIESGVDRGASALFAAACGYAAYIWFAHHVAPVMLLAQTCASAAFAYLLSLRALSMVKPEPRRLPVPVFDVRGVEPFEEAELRLIGCARSTVVEEDPDPLVLVDALPQPEMDSRVVRLFDTAAMPPQVSDPSVELELGSEELPSQGGDASEALHEALAELRRSLR